jgi:hypothetical protein
MEEGSIVGDPAAGRLNRTYTVLLLVYGGLALLIAAGTYRATAGLEVAWRSNLALSSGIRLLLGTIALWVGLLRLFRGVPSLPASIVISVATVLDFPLGTLLFFYWLILVRPGERQPPSRHRAADRYTTILFIVGLGLWISAVTFLTLLPKPGATDFLGILGYVYGGLGFLFLAVGSIRCLGRRWGYSATFGLNVLLLLLVPVGTALSLYWFLSMRKREIVEEPDGLAVVTELE